MNAQKALITGVSGFVGPYLVRHLMASGFEVFGCDRKGSAVDGCVVDKCDVMDYDSVFSVVKRVRPDFVFHLAGQSSVERSWKEPELTRTVHVIGAKNLLGAVAAAGLNPKILIVSSAEVYGIPEKLPITEDHPLRPITPYGESRVEQEKVALSYFRSKGVRLVISRSFNQTGPGQPSAFVCSDFARQVVEAEHGIRKEIVVGNLDIRRDFTDVRDAVGAYLLALQKGKPGEIYNVCSGSSYSMRYVLDTLISFSAKAKSARIVKDVSKTRKTDIPELVGDNAKFRKATGWKPSIKFETTLSEMLDYWRRSL
ncbi:GDP-mannose 4,6-dehydratase [Candidatus Woesearchaeota archaeon]|nr:GDP-mannose 4,6-dehydratase [Candidatus Woesearchaeota archaeon]